MCLQFLFIKKKDIVGIHVHIVGSMGALIKVFYMNRQVDETKKR